MAVPKKKRSRARTRHKRSAWAQKTGPTVGTCANCGARKLPHRICQSCGYYAGREVGSKEAVATTNQ